MSRFFVNDPPIAISEFDETEVVSDRAPNVVWIRARMDVATRGKVSSELLRLGENGQGLEGHFGDNALALLLHNVIRWEGPDFVDDMGKPVPCTPENIRKLDTADPFIDKVLDAIGERNKKRESPKAGSVSSSSNTNAGARPLTVSESLALVNGTPRSSLQSAITGHRERSENSTPTT